LTKHYRSELNLIEGPFDNIARLPPTITNQGYDNDDSSGDTTSRHLGYEENGGQILRSRLINENNEGTDGGCEMQGPLRCYSDTQRGIRLRPYG